MSYLLRRGKRRYRSIRPSPELPRLAFHTFVSILLGTIATIITSFFGDPQVILQNVSHVHRFLGTCFALFFSVLAIILAFRTGSSDKPIKELERVGLLSNIVKRCYLSVIIVGFLYFVLTSITVFNTLSLTLLITIPIEGGLQLDAIETAGLVFIMSSLVITMIRIMSCFHILYRLEANLR